LSFRNLRLPDQTQKTETAMNYQEVAFIAALLFSPTVPPLLLIHSGGTAVAGLHPVWRVPHVSFLTILSIVGRKAGLLTVTLAVCRCPHELLNPHDRIFQGRERANHDIRSLSPSDSENHVG